MHPNVWKSSESVKNSPGEGAQGPRKTCTWTSKAAWPAGLTRMTPVMLPVPGGGLAVKNTCTLANPGTEATSGASTLTHSVRLATVKATGSQPVFESVKEARTPGAAPTSVELAESVPGHAVGVGGTGVGVGGTGVGVGGAGVAVGVAAGGVAVAVAAGDGVPGGRVAVGAAADAEGAPPGAVPPGEADGDADGDGVAVIVAGGGAGVMTVT